VTVTIGVNGRADIDSRVRIAREVVETWEKIADEDPVIASGLAEALDRGPNLVSARFGREIVGRLRALDGLVGLQPLGQ
jgi:hypothetical protein